MASRTALQHGTAPFRATRIEPLREAITRMAALGFAAGVIGRLVLSDPVRWQDVVVGALYLPIGAVAAAVVAGVLVNLIALPTLCRFVPGHRLPDAVYRSAGMLSGLAAFAAALAAFLPGSA